MIRKLCLTISRFALAAWVGAAALFVITSVIEVRSFDSTTRATLALLRFPAYYACGFALIATALITGLAACTDAARTRRATKTAMGLIALALLLMYIDYVWIYRPMVGMIEIPQAARPAGFQDYHKASMYINAVDVGCCMIAALLLCWPANRSDR